MFTENQFKSIASKLHTLIDIKIYPKYGFSTVSYMTDMFGGTYAHFHIDLNTGETTIDYGAPQQLTINDIKDLEAIVESRMNDMIKNRDLNHIYELINSEYD